ncbi:Nucleic-acid-binding protein from transposon X-element [Eumeta japonica]|uniref:Nucleic-acid-binding protein from transposon X-element n=1 Tax=Eumeta variegata TaxID=151549 RepID=A0A4C1VUI6_EUMVA|nr:Nucleic-acid-binding protein from transposon X-element [Eumeta japonica]
MVLVILDRNDQAREIFKKLCRVCGLSGVVVEEPYKRGMPGQCHRYQLYGHAAANRFAQPRCVKCLVPHWTKDCERTKESGGRPSCCNCGQEHTANYGRCSVAPKPKPLKFKAINRTNPSVIKNLNGSQFPPLHQPNRPATKADSKNTSETAGRRISRPAPPLLTNGRSRFHGLSSNLYRRLTLGSYQVKRRVVPGPKRPHWGRTLIL